MAGGSEGAPPRVVCLACVVASRHDPQRRHRCSVSRTSPVTPTSWMSSSLSPPSASPPRSSCCGASQMSSSSTGRLCWEAAPPRARFAAGGAAATASSSVSPVRSTTSTWIFPAAPAMWAQWTTKTPPSETTCGEHGEPPGRTRVRIRLLTGSLWVIHYSSGGELQLVPSATRHLRKRSRDPRKALAAVAATHVCGRNARACWSGRVSKPGCCAGNASLSSACTHCFPRHNCCRSARTHRGAGPTGA